MYILKSLFFTSILLLLAACGQESFQSTCSGFSKRYATLNEDRQNHGATCSCLESTLSDFSPEEIETVRSAMSAGIISQSRMQSALNKAVNDGFLSQDQRNKFDLSIGSCMTGTTVENKKVNSMIEQFQSLQ